MRARPNFVFILADDLGYADLGCYGARSSDSPVFDAMAEEGLRFIHGYANSAVCSPTRFALATGRWQHRLLEAAGVAPHPDYPLDGRSLLGVLRDPGALFERRLYWRMKFRNQKALRDGRWKYLVTDDGEFLFDLAADERERANLARRHTERLLAMRHELWRWESEVGPPSELALADQPYTRADLAHPSS